MGIIASSESKIRTEETSYRSSVSEAIAQKIGANINSLIDDKDTNTSQISTNTGNISTNTGNISTNTANIGTNTSNIALIGDVTVNAYNQTGINVSYTIPTGYIGVVTNVSGSAGTGTYSLTKGSLSQVIADDVSGEISFKQLVTAVCLFQGATVSRTGPSGTATLAVDIIRIGV